MINNFDKQKVKKTVLCVGASTYDMNFVISNMPGTDEKTTAESMSVCGGGPASNAAITVSRMGLDSVFIGYIGNDAQGDFVLKEFLNEGVNTQFILRGSDPTPVSVNIAEREGSRYLINYSKQKYFLKSGDIDLSKLDPEVILFDGHEPYISMDLINMFSSGGKKTILDAGSLHPGTIDLMGKVDYLVCSEKFAFEYTAKKNIDAALDVLLKVNRNVVITLGEKGLVWGSGLTHGKLPAIKIKAIDTTGAGDSFHGGFAYCIAENIDWELTLKFSSLIAAKCCMHSGARDGIPFLDEVKYYLSGDRAIPSSL